MNINELQHRVNELIAPMLTKGLVLPKATATIEANGAGGISLSWQWRARELHDPWDDRNFASRWFWANPRDDGLEPWDGALQEAMREIMAMPDKAERQRDEFLKLLAQTTEYGRSVGIEEEFVNPLTILAKKLSENALTGPERIVLNVSEEARAGLDTPPKPMFDDEIPF